MTSESTTTAAPLKVMAFDRVSAEIQARADISLADLPEDFEARNMLEFPSADLPPETRTLPNGKTTQYNRTVKDTNPKFYFCWLDATDARQPEWSGYKPVTRIDGLTIPARHFSADGTIVRGDLRLYVAKAAYAAAHKQNYRSLTERRLDAYKSKGVVATTTDASGAEMGRVIQNQLGSKLLMEGDAKATRNKSNER